MNIFCQTCELISKWPNSSLHTDTLNLILSNLAGQILPFLGRFRLGPGLLYPVDYCFLINVCFSNPTSPPLGFSGLVPCGANLHLKFPRIQLFFFLSALLRDYSLCWDHWNGTMTPTLDAALPCIVHRNGVTTISSRAGTDLGLLSDVAHVCR